METRFASPDRSSDDVVLQLFKKLNQLPIVQELINKSIEFMFILDKNRQIVFANQAFMDLLGVKSFPEIIGLRPGEAVGCIHSDEVSGCGTSEFCVTCGAVNAVVKSQDNNVKVEEECLLSIGGNKSVELLVVAQPFDYFGYSFTFVSAKDIGETKRKKTLEKMFFHDILNLANGIYSVADLLNEEPLSDLPPEMRKLLHQSSLNMINEISDYRTLILAEKDELKVVRTNVDCTDILQGCALLYKNLAFQRGVELVLLNNTEMLQIKTDYNLLHRVLINMIKNAIEASGIGDKVTIWKEAKNNSVLFHVKNETVMPESVKLQIFQRTFTTKENGSGLGTYSMRLLSEQYLHGKVSFVSNEDDGTVFTVSIPVE